MPTIKRFEDLESWQEARNLMKIIYKIIKNDRFRKDLRLVGQITGSAVSAMSNIAEGFHRNSNREFMRFLDYSRASVAETLSHSYVALDQEYISQEEMERVKEQAEFVWKKVNNFISYLNQGSKSHKESRKYESMDFVDKKERRHETHKTNGTDRTSKTNPTN